MHERTKGITTEHIFSQTGGSSEIRVSNGGAASISTKFRNQIVGELVLGAIIERENLHLNFEHLSDFISAVGLTLSCRVILLVSAIQNCDSLRCTFTVTLIRYDTGQLSHNPRTSEVAQLESCRSFGVSFHHGHTSFANPGGALS